MVEHSLDPIYDENSEILILGSMPSVKSREIGFYYAHPQNRFYKVLSILFQEEIPITIEDKKEFLLKHHIALFDVIKRCSIDGSKDSSIKEFEVNSFKKILQNSHIEKIFTTGKKAYDLYQKYCLDETNMEAIYLPSSSPANIANYSLEQLVESYSIILNYIKK